MWEWLASVLRPIASLLLWVTKRTRDERDTEAHIDEQLEDESAPLKRRKVESDVDEKNNKDGDGYLILMRHSVRADSEGIQCVPESTWPDKNERPYDPPICDFTLPRESAQKLKKYDIKKIITSPYRRCLQTAGIVARELGIKKVDIDDGVGEWFRQVQRCCSEVGAETFAAVPPLSLENVHKELGEGVTVGEWKRVEVADMDTWFLVPRVHKAIGSIIESNPSSSTLVITHGDIANRWLPEAEYMPEYSYLRLHEAGYVVLKKSSQRSVPSDIIEEHLTEVM